MRLYSERWNTGFIHLGPSHGWALTINEGGRGLTLWFWPSGPVPFRIYIAGWVWCWRRS